MRNISGPRELTLFMAHYDLHPQDETSWEQAAMVGYCSANRFKHPIPMEKLKPNRGNKEMTAKELASSMDAMVARNGG